MEKNTNAAFANLNFDYCVNEMFKIRNSKKKYWNFFVYEKRFKWNKKNWSNTWLILGLWFQI